MKIKLTAHGTHVFKRNFSPAISDKRCTWNTTFSNHTNYSHAIETEFNQRIFTVMWKHPIMMREMLSP